MDMKLSQDNQNLVAFWDQAFSLSEEDRKELLQSDPESWKEMAPSEKLSRAAASLANRKKVLDYGCGNAWAGIIAAKNGCTDVTAVDLAPGAVDAAKAYAALYGAEKQMNISLVGPEWLKTVPADSYDGIICSNVLDVVPPETAAEILRELARISTDDASVIIGLNFYLSPEAAAQRNMNLADGNRLYVDGVLRLVSRSDDEWKKEFKSFFSVERLEHFAWPGEEKETRRLFYLKKRCARIERK